MRISYLGVSLIVVKLTHSAGGEHGPDRDADAAEGARQPHQVHQQEQAERESPQTVGAEEADGGGGGDEADDNDSEEAEEEAAEQVSSELRFLYFSAKCEHSGAKETSTAEMETDKRAWSRFHRWSSPARKFRL